MAADCARHINNKHSAPVRLRLQELASSVGQRLHMTKKYVALPVTRRDHGGNIVRGFVMGLAEFGCFGRQLYDLSGSPYHSEADSISADWQAVGEDLWKVLEQTHAENPDGHERREHEAPENTGTTKLRRE